MKVTVLGGGNSTERDISIWSARAVSDALKEAGFEVSDVDPADGFGTLDPVSGVVFPILHGQGGEDGEIQKELEKRNLPYLGSDSRASIVCFDKLETRTVLEEAGLPVAKGAQVTKDTYFQNPLSSKPHVLKVVHGGSSIGTYIVRDPKVIDPSKVEDVFRLESTALIEELVEGTEITVPILDNQPLPVIEIIPPEGEEFDYDNKYNGRTKEICPPQSVSDELCQKAQRLAVDVHNALGARHLSRTDIIITPEGRMVVLELNTMPGMTEQSFFPLSAKVSGLSMPQLMERFVDLVKRDYKLN